MAAINNNKNFIAGLTAALAASLCCITPLLAFLIGVGGAASSLSRIAPLRPYLVGCTILIFAFAWFQKLKPQKQDDCGCAPDIKESWLKSKMFLTIVTLVAGLLMAFPYYSSAFYPHIKPPQVVAPEKSELRQARLKIKGMTCQGCSVAINNAVSKVPGVVNFEVSYEKGISIVLFSSRSTTSIDSIVAAINSTGYSVVSQTLIKN